MTQHRISRGVFLFGLVAFAFFAVFYNDSIAQPNEGPKTIGERIWDGYYKSQVSVRYHLDRAGFYESWNLRSKIALLSSGILALGLAVYFANKRVNKGWKICLLAVEGAVLTLSISLVLMDFGRAASLHENLCDEWQSLAHQWDEAREARKEESDQELGKRLALLLEKERSIEEREPKGSYDIQLMRSKQKELNHAMGLIASAKTK